MNQTQAFAFFSSLALRVKDVEEIRQAHPTKIPVIIERNRGENETS